MFGLIDCNNFYVSCERVFRPDLNGKPVVVLSSNDGYVISRSDEVKALGVDMRIPTFRTSEIIEKHKINVFSSNYTLYGDMSGRVMSIIAENVPEIEIYSIDEAFVNLTGIEDLQSLGTDIVNKVCKGTGIPVGIGIAPTKTLAKLANRFAKKFPGYKRVCIIDTDEKRIKALQLTSIDDVWGIGSGSVRKLMERGVKTAWDFTKLPQAWVRKNMTVTGERTWQELQGIPCYQMDLMPPTKKNICTSRSFGSMISDEEIIAEAISSHAALCAKKLRQQKVYARSVMVFIHTNEFRKDLPQYFKNVIIHLPVATNDTMEIIHYALAGFKQIFKEGYLYKKTGVVISEIADNAQTGLFDEIDRSKREKLMTVMDKLNADCHPKIKLAIQGDGQKWKLKQEKLSQRYSTNLKEIIRISCK